MRNFGLLTIVAIVFLSRFLPHPPNMTAVGALAIFSGFFIRPRTMALVFPLGVMLFTDFVIGFHNTMVFTYSAWALLALAISLGFKKFSWSGMAVSSVGAALWFFVVSNFGVWFVGGLYPKTGFGLVECFVAALPFFGNELLGNLVFSAALFGIWNFAEKKVLALQLR
jgi:hypothetical protein